MTTTTLSRETILAETATPIGPLLLIHRTAGTIIAGSGWIERPEAWAAITLCRTDGCRYGQWFKTEPEARTRYETVRAANPML
jgi:hypothetical protein